MPVLFFNYVGFELPSAAGDEMKDPQKDVPFTVLRAAITAILLYGLPILAVIAVLPKDEITGVDGFMTAVAAVFSVWGGAASVMTKIAAFGFVLALVSSACTWLMGSDRSQAVACYDGAGPRILGRFSAKLGTPVNVNFLSGVISTIVFVAAARIAGGSASATFDVMIGIVLTFTTISYIVIFPALIKLRYSHPHVNRPYRVPGRHGGRLDLRRALHLLGRLRLARGHLPGLRSTANCSTTPGCRKTSRAPSTRRSPPSRSGSPPSRGSSSTGSARHARRWSTCRSRATRSWPRRRASPRRRHRERVRNDAGAKAPASFRVANPVSAPTLRRCAATT